MKIFYGSEKTWPTKVNFVDENNVVLGYDIEDLWCEHATWQFVNYEEKTIPEHIDKYQFDPDYIESGCDHVSLNLDAGDAKKFRLMADNMPDLYLIISNSHNGYYSHGFTWLVPGKSVVSGSLWKQYWIIGNIPIFQAKFISSNLIYRISFLKEQHESRKIQ